ncbi:hypothetical protein [Larkinella terrae]|uniref:Outer membrane beta-barrel protein n=1 Tax=Larkinella terrae TaxID=2025311 RepID=A0A7K0EFU4_9BACT|nr:hypothetical protein [Larkinella terrae]MRS60326.1 hypothetical protein [Larkinella terrae]
MRSFFLTALLGLFVHAALAQTPRTDVLHKLDRSTLNVKVDEVTETDVVYFEATAPTVRKMLPKNGLWKLVFADGSTEVFNQPTELPAAPPLESVAQRKDSTFRKPPTSPGYRINLTVGTEVSYFPAGLNKDWVDDSLGYGMDQNLGFSVRFDYRFIRPLAASLTVGYSQWELLRRYTQNGSDQYQETVTMRRIPLQAGLKIYVANHFFLLPSGGINLLTIKRKASETHPNPTAENTSSTPITYGASLGYEFHAGRFLVDLSGQYQLLNIRQTTSAPGSATQQKVQFAGLRLGLGFSTKK